MRKWKSTSFLNIKVRYCFLTFIYRFLGLRYGGSHEYTNLFQWDTTNAFRHAYRIFVLPAFWFLKIVPISSQLIFCYFRLEDIYGPSLELLRFSVFKDSMIQNIYVNTYEIYFSFKISTFLVYLYLGTGLLIPRYLIPPL